MININYFLYQKEDTIMFGIKKVKQYNSKNYDLSNTKDFEEFYDLVDIINDFDFAIDRSIIVYTTDYQKANIHVETREKMLEIWLIKHQFQEA